MSKIYVTEKEFDCLNYMTWGRPYKSLPFHNNTIRSLIKKEYIGLISIYFNDPSIPKTSDRIKLMYIKIKDWDEK